MALRATQRPLWPERKGGPLALSLCSLSLALAQPPPLTCRANRYQRCVPRTYRFQRCLWLDQRRIQDDHWKCPFLPRSLGRCLPQPCI